MVLDPHPLLLAKASNHNLAIAKAKASYDHLGPGPTWAQGPLGPQGPIGPGTHGPMGRPWALGPMGQGVLGRTWAQGLPWTLAPREPWAYFIITGFGYFMICVSRVGSMKSSNSQKLWLFPMT